MSRDTRADGSAAPDSVYYQHSGRLPLASRLSLRARREMFALFMRHLSPTRDTRVLDVGVTSDSFFPESNYFERLYPYPNRITAVGTEDGSHLAERYPGLQYLRVAPGVPLPFDAGAFDVVFSNAVIEHVGGRASQEAFVAELCRVGRAFFITTPNRWFPVEHHTGVPLLHYLPSSLHRAVLNRTRYRYWATEETLNILTARSFRRLFPADSSVQILGVTTLGLTSNLVAVGPSR
jgi:SAM-dependent methyltransferase